MRFRQWFYKLENNLALFGSGALVIFSMLYVTFNVIARYLFSKPLAGMVELVGLMLVPLAFLNAPRTWRTPGGIIRIMFFMDKFPPKVVKVLDIIMYFWTLIVFAGILGWILGVGALEAYIGKDQYGSYGSAVYTWPFKALMSLSLFLMGIRMIIDLTQYFRGRPMIEDWEKEFGGGRKTSFRR